MEKLKRWNINLYIINLALLITHEIDSAFWKEWELFGMQGDIQGFVVTNFALVLIGLIGLKWLVSGGKNALYIALFFAVGGIIAFAVHTYFIMNGYKEFTLPASMAILIAALVASVIQTVLTLKILSEKKGGKSIE